MIHIPSLNFDLGETVDMLRDAVQDFAQAEIAPLAAEIDRSNEFPNQLWPKLGDMGLLGITVPESYGGSAMGYLAHIVAIATGQDDHSLHLFNRNPEIDCARPRQNSTARLS